MILYRLTIIFTAICDRYYKTHIISIIVSQKSNLNNLYSRNDWLKFIKMSGYLIFNNGYSSNSLFWPGYVEPLWKE